MTSLVSHPRVEPSLPPLDRQQLVEQLFLELLRLPASGLLEKLERRLLRCGGERGAYAARHLTGDNASAYCRGVFGMAVMDALALPETVLRTAADAARRAA